MPGAGIGPVFSERLLLLWLSGHKVILTARENETLEIPTKSL